MGLTPTPKPCALGFTRGKRFLPKKGRGATDDPAPTALMTDAWERSQWGVCYVCGKKMIQGGDHDDIDADENEVIVSNFHCPSCQSDCLFTWRVNAS